MNTLRLGLVLILCFCGIGQSLAGVSEGVTAYNQGDYSTALYEFIQMAEQGDAGAQYSVGVMYENGEGVLQGYSEAVKWYRLAALQGMAKAQLKMATMYLGGKGVLQNYSEAVKWHRLAAQQGFAEAQFILALMYKKGEDLPLHTRENLPLNISEGFLHSYMYGHMWANLAAHNGYIKAKDLREEIEGNMTSTQVNEAQQLARECLESNYKNCD